MLAFTKKGPYSDPALPQTGRSLISIDVHGTRAGIVINSDATKRAVKACFAYFIARAPTANGVLTPSAVVQSGTSAGEVPLFAFFEASDLQSKGDERRTVLRYPTGEYFESSELRNLLPLLIGTVTQNVTQRLRGVSVIHSAALNRDARGVVLIGASGSGKTTLALALCQGGCEFLSDEFAAIDMTSHLLLPFPRPILPRENTMRLLGLPNDREYTFDEADGRRYLIDPTDPRCGITIGAPAPIDAVLLIQRREGPPCTEPTTGASALESVAGNLINACRLPQQERVRMLTALFNVVRGARCLKLHSSAIPETVSAILRAMDAPRRPMPPDSETQLERVYQSARQKLERLVVQ